VAQSDPVPSRHFDHVANTKRPYVIQSYCPLCGFFIAASSNPKLIEIAEQEHQCLESLKFIVPPK
jgi:hypothetical protein